MGEDTEPKLERRLNELLRSRRSQGCPAVVHPETRDVLERASYWTRRLRNGGQDPDSITPKHPWIANCRNRPSLEQAWLLVDDLHALWIGRASDHDIWMEFSSKSGPPQHVSTEDRRGWLRQQHAQTAALGRHNRLLISLRTRYLRKAGTLLGVLVLVAVVFGIVHWLTEGTTIKGQLIFPLSALAGSIGGALSGSLNVREAYTQSATRAFQTWWWVQPIVGAAVGLFMSVLLMSQVLTLPGTTAIGIQKVWAILVYALVAAFSEPFFLGILSRLGASANKAAEASAEQSPPSHATSVEKNDPSS